MIVSAKQTARAAPVISGPPQKGIPHRMRDLHACSHAVRWRLPSHPTRLVTEQAAGPAATDVSRTFGLLGRMAGAGRNLTDRFGVGIWGSGHRMDKGLWSRRSSM